jgi:hypothetical protein
MSGFCNLYVIYKSVTWFYKIPVADVTKDIQPWVVKTQQFLSANGRHRAALKNIIETYCLRQ